MAFRPAPSGIRTPAGRMNGLTMSPTRSVNCSTRPSTPARTTVFVQIHLGLSQLGLGAGLLGRQESGDPRLGRLLRGGGGVDRALAPLHGDCELLDIPEGDVARIAPIQLLLGLQLVHSLLIGAPGLLDLALRLPGCRSARPPWPPRPRRSCGGRSPPPPPASSCRAGRSARPASTSPLTPSR